MKLRSYFRRIFDAFDIPHVPKIPPKAKSALRLQFESEWSEVVNSASRALNLAVLGSVSGVCLVLTSLLRGFDRMHAALARHEDERKNRERIDHMNAFFAKDRPMRTHRGWEKDRQYEKETCS